MEQRTRRVYYLLEWFQMQRSESFRGFEQKLNMTEFKVKIGFNLFGSISDIRKDRKWHFVLGSRKSEKQRLLAETGFVGICSKCTCGPLLTVPGSLWVCFFRGQLRSEVFLLHYSSLWVLKLQSTVWGSRCDRGRKRHWLTECRWKIAADHRSTWASWCLRGCCTAHWGTFSCCSLIGLRLLLLLTCVFKNSLISLEQLCMIQSSEESFSFLTFVRNHLF